MTSSRRSYQHPVERLKERAEDLEKRRDKTRVECPECGTTVWGDSVEDAVGMAERHDEKRHDGEPTTEVMGMTPPSFTEEEKAKIQDAVKMFREGNDAQ